MQVSQEMEGKKKRRKISAMDLKKERSQPWISGKIKKNGEGQTRKSILIGPYKYAIRKTLKPNPVDLELEMEAEDLEFQSVDMEAFAARIQSRIQSAEDLEDLELEMEAQTLIINDVIINNVYCTWASQPHGSEEEPSYAVLNLAMPVLVGLLQVYHGGSSFQAHPWPSNMYVFLGAFSIYVVGIWSKKEIGSRWSRVYSSSLLLLSGSLSLVSLASTFFPGFYGNLMFLIWALLPILLLRAWVIHICSLICQKIMNLLRHLHEKFWNVPHLPGLARTFGLSETEDRNSLPI